eukprot:9094701-Prorocentrum_lima.AAC.1
MPMTTITPLSEQATYLSNSRPLRSSKARAVVLALARNPRWASRAASHKHHSIDVEMPALASVDFVG